MSASNWAVCPRCTVQRQETVEALDIDLGNAYGQVPIEEFDRLRNERNAIANAEPERTFREDYEITGAESGIVHVSYGGGCQVCGLALAFEVDKPINRWAVTS